MLSKDIIVCVCVWVCVYESVHKPLMKTDITSEWNHMTIVSWNLTKKNVLKTQKGRCILVRD